MDVGTNNVKLRNDPYYLGLDQPRVSGNAYYDILDEASSSHQGWYQEFILPTDEA